MPCTTILVGKKATIDGSLLIARTDDGGFTTKRVTVMLPKKQPRKYKSVNAHLTIELPDDPFRYTCAPNVELKKEGIWSACGINSANVAMTATETITTNSRVLAADPLVKYKKREGKEPEKIGGIGEEDLVTIILPYIRTAREGVERLGMLLEKYGTYESNGIAFSDEKEIWWVETIGGHHYIARRVPDDRVVIMPNQFGMDEFDFDDALGAKKENLCSADLYDFVVKNKLYAGKEMKNFNPRFAFGSCRDADHIYNTPRAWYMARYFLERTYSFDGENAQFKPESNDIPWSFVPEHKVSVEDIRTVLGSYYQGTPYNPYGKAPEAGKYRVIGVPNSDVLGILQIRPDMPVAIRGIEWLSLGGSGFTACFPVYTQVDSLPTYISGTTADVSTDYMYWQSRLIAVMTDAQFSTALIHNERYRDEVENLGRELLHDCDERVISGEWNEGNEVEKILTEANKKITDMVKKQSDEVMKLLLGNASEHMHTRYHRGDQ